MGGVAERVRERLHLLHLLAEVDELDDFVLDEGDIPRAVDLQVLHKVLVLVFVQHHLVLLQDILGLFWIGLLEVALKVFLFGVVADALQHLLVVYLIPVFHQELVVGLPRSEQDTSLRLVLFFLAKPNQLVVSPLEGTPRQLHWVRWIVQ